MLELVINNPKLPTAEPQADLEFLPSAVAGSGQWGSIWLLRPLNTHGAAWMAGNIDGEPWKQTSLGVCIDFRYVDRILETAVGDGCIVKCDAKLPGIGRADFA